MTFNATTAPQLAAAAGSGDLNALETLLRDMIEHVANLTPAELGYIDGVTPGTLAAGKALVANAGGNVIAGAGNLVGITPITHTTATLTLTQALHANRTVVLDRAGGIAVTLPAATGTGDKYRLVVKTTFTGAASVKSATGADIMVGHALMGNDSDNAVVDWRAVAGSTIDTVDLFGTANSTGGLAGQELLFEDVGTNLWLVSIRGDAAGTEATPFANTVA